MRVAGVIIASGLFLVPAAVAQAPRVVLDDGFRAIDPAVSMPATNGRWQIGEPNHSQIMDPEGRTVLLMRSTLTGPERRGYITVGTFPGRATTVEMDFSAREGEGVPVELWIYFRYGDPMIALGPAAVGKGRLVRMETTASLTTYGPSPVWSTRRWYRLTFEARPSGARASLRNLEGDQAADEVWSARYPWVLCEIAPEWGLGIVQLMPPGEAGISEGAVDRVRVTVGCGADLDGDGAVTVADAVAFMSMYVDRRCAADMDDDWHLTLNDFTTFLAAMAVECR